MKSFIDRLRTLLILGRVSNLPTVWSNLLAGWIIAGGTYDTSVLILFVLLGGSFLYVGGMYLNDYCDADFDARYCPERPIPAGKISRRTVGFLAVLWFTAGFGCLASFGPIAVGTTLLLISAIVLYDFHHKNVAWAPLLMAFCRCLLYLLAASSGRNSCFGYFHGTWSNDTLGFVHGPWSVDALKVTLNVFPAAIPLGLYVAGITYLARGESRPGKPTRWALLLLLMPVAFSFVTYACLNSSYIPLPLLPVILICALQLYWMVCLLVPFWRKTKPSIGRVVSGLLAGIVLVDIIALIPSIGPLGIVLFPLFALALLLQRVIPAT